MAIAEPIEYPQVSTHDVAYGAVAKGLSFHTRRHASQNTYLYVAKGQSFTLIVPPDQGGEVHIPQGSILSISGLIPHSIRVHNEHNQQPHLQSQRLDQVVQPVTQLNKSDVGLLVGKLHDDAYAITGAYLGYQLVTAEAAPLLHHRLSSLIALLELELRTPLSNMQNAVRILSQSIQAYGNRFVRKKSEQTQRIQPATLEQRLVSVVLLICKEPLTAWSVASLASTVGMSRTSFAIEFRKRFNRTPMEVVRHTRLASSLNRLEFSSDPIEVIAQRCAYGSAPAFIRAFKDEFGVSPAKWRKEVRMQTHADPFRWNLHN